MPRWFSRISALVADGRDRRANADLSNHSRASSAAMPGRRWKVMRKREPNYMCNYLFLYLNVGQASKQGQQKGQQVPAGDGQISRRYRVNVDAACANSNKFCSLIGLARAYPTARPSSASLSHSKTLETVRLIPNGATERDMISEIECFKVVVWPRNSTAF